MTLAASASLGMFAQETVPTGQEAFLDSLTATNEGEMVQVAYRKVNQNDLLGGVSFVNVEKLMDKNYITYSLTDMQNYVGGWNGNSLWGMDSYLCLVDGVPRDANNVMPSEIEQISFLKGAAAVVLYGSRAADGVIALPPNVVKKARPALMYGEIPVFTYLSVIRNIWERPNT